MATLAHNLSVRRTAVEDAGLVTSVGWLGDAAHQAECSDHNADAVGRVHAIDCMTLNLANQKAIVQWCQAHPEDLEYFINQRTIWSRSRGFAPHAYTGTDPHTNHVHISGRHGSAHEDTATCTGYSLTAEAMTPEGITVAITPADVKLIVDGLVADKNFQALIWRTNALIDQTDVAGGPTVGETNELAKAVKDIPTTAAPAAPQDAAATAALVLKNMTLVQKPAA